MSRLVIAEKPFVAQSIVYWGVDRKDVSLESGWYLVGWCCGHPVELSYASAYIRISRYRTSPS